MNSEYIVSKLIYHGVPADDARILAAVAYGESGYQPGIAGDRGNSIGLFQIHIPAHYDKLTNWTGSSSRTVWEDWLRVPDNNIFAAAKVYQSQGLGAWTVYNTGAYKPYLGNAYSVSTGVQQAVSTGVHDVSTGVPPVEAVSGLSLSPAVVMVVLVVLAVALSGGRRRGSQVKDREG